MSGESSCLHIPAGSKFIKVYDFMVAICDGNECAAALLAFHAGWHDTKIRSARKAAEDNDVAETHGLARRRSHEALYQTQTDEEIEASIFFYKRRSFPPAYKILADKKFLTIFRNPNPKFKFDRRRFLLFHPENVNRAIAQYTRERKIAESSGKNAAGGANLPDISTDRDTDKTTKGRKGKKRSPETRLPEEFRNLTPEWFEIAEAEIGKVDLIEPAVGWRTWIVRSHSAFVNNADQHERLARNWSAAFRNWISGGIDRGLENGTLALAGTGGRKAERGRVNGEDHDDDDAESAELAAQVEEQRRRREEARRAK